MVGGGYQPACVRLMCRRRLADVTSDSSLLAALCVVNKLVRQSWSSGYVVRQCFAGSYALG